MKHVYVKTSNHMAFMAAIAKVQALAGHEKRAQIVLVTGAPSLGKTKTLEYYGADSNSIYILGRKGMTLSYIRELIAYELGLPHLRGFKQQQAVDTRMKGRGNCIIFDEAQFGLDSKATVIEYLRGIADQCSGVLILACHTSERYNFCDANLAHLANRTNAEVEFSPASLEDAALYLQKVCEVELDMEVVKQVQNEAEGRYGAMYSACMGLEVLARQLGVTRLQRQDTQAVKLCEEGLRMPKTNGKKHG